MTTPVVLKSQDRYSAQPRWLHYFVVTSAGVVLMELDRALMGWNVRKVTRAHPDDWAGLTPDEIVAWKLRNHDVEKCEVGETDRVLDLVAQKIGG